MTAPASKLAKAAALIMMTPALLLPIKVSAQQVASSRPDYSVCDRRWPNNPNAHSQCLVDTLNEHTRQLRAHTRQMQAESAQARRESADARRESADARLDSQCARELLDMKARDPAVLERGRAILGGRPTAEYGVCNLLAALKRG